MVESAGAARGREREGDPSRLGGEGEGGEKRSTEDAQAHTSTVSGRSVAGGEGRGGGGCDEPQQKTLRRGGGKGARQNTRTGAHTAAVLMRRGTTAQSS